MNLAQTTQTAAQLKEAFDRAFAVERERQAIPASSMLHILVGSEARPYVLGLSGLALLRRSPRVAPLPGGRGELLGLATLRGRTVPVFSLARLLGLQAERDADWIVGVGSELDFALQFEHLEAIVQIDPAQLREAPGVQQRHVGQLCVVGRVSLPVLDVESIREAIRPAPHSPRGATHV